MKFWRQNEDLEVEVDITQDPKDEPPFNNGPNLYLRIKNRRHRGVSTPFQQRSRGFIWFFSFLVWFDSVQHQLDANRQASERDLIRIRIHSAQNGLRQSGGQIPKQENRHGMTSGFLTPLCHLSQVGSKPTTKKRPPIFWGP
jgi:hypothetical protein